MGFEITERSINLKVFVKLRVCRQEDFKATVHQNIWAPQDLAEAHFEAQLKNRENDVVAWYSVSFFLGGRENKVTYDCIK